MMLYTAALLRLVKQLDKLDPTVRNFAREKDLTIYGARAMNARLHPPLRKFTMDYDIYSQNPRLKARLLEQRLDRKFGGDYFYVSPAKHPGTWKVRLQKEFGNREVADFTKPPRKRFKGGKVKGNRYVPLKMVERDKKKSVRDPTYKFRYGKDKEDLRRIQANRMLNRFKRKESAKRMR